MSIRGFLISLAANFAVAGVVWYLKGPNGGAICLAIGFTLVLIASLWRGLPASRPLIVPVRYGKGNTQRDYGYTGLAVVNEKEPAYEISPSSVEVGRIARITFQGWKDRLTKEDGEAFFAAFIEQTSGSGMFGSYLFDFMRERGLDDLTIPVKYRGIDNNKWYQTNVKIERDVLAQGGLRLSWTQIRIPKPKSSSSA